MASDDLSGLIALNSPRAFVPAHDLALRVEHEYRVVGYFLDHEAKLRLIRMQTGLHGFRKMFASSH